MCGAPQQDLDLPAGFDAGRATLLQGRVLRGADPVAGAFVRLLDGGGDFTAEVVAASDGRFRFYAGPGDWTVRALSRDGNAQSAVRAAGPGVYSVDVLLH